jgi:hypothetical protein
MIPHNRELVSRMQGKPFVFVGINSDESRSALEKTIEKEQINYPNIYDGRPGEGPINVQWNIMGWPTIYVLDHEGVIRARVGGHEELEKVVTELVSKAPAKPSR